MDLSEILKKTEQRSAKLPRPKPHLVSGDGPRPYDEDVKRYQESLLKHDGNDSGTTREQSTAISGTTREQTEVISGTNAPISGTTREQSTAISGTTRERLGNKQRLPREQTVTTREQSTAISGTTREQTEVISGTNAPISGTTREQVPVIEPLTREQVPVISAVSSPITGTTESFVPEYSGTKTGTITGTKSVIPTGKQEQQLLQFLLQQQLQHDELRTPLLSRDKISEDTKIPLGNVKIVISRLVEKGAIARVDVSKSRSAGGTSFSISRAVRRSLQELITGTKTGTKTGTSQTLVSSSSLNTTTTDKDRSELFQNACERYGLHDTGIGANDLLQIWRKGVFQTEEDFITSMEHIAFYLGTVEAKTLTHPKAWVTSQLTKGFYPAPVGFKSCEELQQEARLSAKRERLARLEELKRQELEADFELWAAELDDDEKRRRLAGTPFAEQPNSKLGRTILREQFIQQNGGELGATI